MHRDSCQKLALYNHLFTFLPNLMTPLIKMARELSDWVSSTAVVLWTVEFVN